FNDYALRHARSSWAYLNPMESKHCLAFGSPRHGKMYKSCDEAAYSDNVGYGWTSGRPQAVTEAPEGAYYSHLTGNGSATFKFGKLQPGLYMLSIGCGNLKSGTKRFSVSVNGEERVKEFELPSGNAVDLTIPVYIEKDTIEIDFSGNYLVSTMNLQMLLNKYEDFCIKRGFWLVDDFEPTLGMLPNSDYKTLPRMPVGKELYPLPEPGKEMANARKPFVRKSAPFKLEPWHYQLKLGSFGQNLSPMAALKPNEAAEKAARFHANKGKNLLIHNGIFARTHLYKSTAEDSEYEVLRRMAAEAHKNNMRIVDHQDYGLVWDCGTGFRTLVELTPILQRNILDHGIYVYHCPSNDDYRKKFFERTLDLIAKTNIDGLMLDEFGYGASAGCCGCAKCRKAFFEETNWYLPVNELSPELNNPASPLWRAFVEFRGKRIGDYWVDLRNMINTIRPDFIFMSYSIHRYFVEGWSSGAMERLRSGLIYGTEIISNNVFNVGRTTFSYRKLKNVVTNCYNIPVIGLVYQGSVEGIGYFGWAMNNMNNQETWFLGSDGPKKDFNKFTENMNHGTAKPIADIAVLFARNSNTGNRNPNVKSNNWLPGKLMGLAQTLDAMHQAYIFIDESFLSPEKLAQYKVVMLPTAEVLTDQQLKVLKDYAANGGRLMLTSATGKLDENRQPRPWPFSDWFGFRPDKLGWGSDMIVNGKKVVIPGKFYFHNIVGEPHQGVTSVISYANAFAPLVIKFAPGKKGLVYWFNGELTRGLYQEEWWHPGSTYGYSKDENLNRIVQEQLSNLIGDAATFKMDAPEKVYTSFYKDGDTTCIHFLNHTGWNFKVGDKMPYTVAPDAFPKLKNPVNVEVKTDQRINEVFAVSMDFAGRRPLTFTQENGKVKFTMPGELLEVYTIVKMR
ncbi:MAG: beta-galactosidase trimerization domain-containing protein, partial [Victivallales bacterium]|nr:beta-galactosidase trimerization domain-containing protein [Victivallales bacterium]